MGWFGSSRENKLVAAIKEVVDAALEDAAKTVDRYKEVRQLQETATSLREQIETLRIEKARKDEDHSRREREIEHKVGLERKRQEFEIEQAKREATVTLREENLAADRKRFEEEMEFTRERFTEEVSYLKDMVGKVLERLPSAEIIATYGGRDGDG